MDSDKPRVQLTSRERRFLAIMYPTGTVAVGSSVGWDLERRGLVRVAKFGRYALTPAGAEAISQWPESEWKIGSEREQRRTDYGR